LKRRGRLPPDEARRIMLETADALGAAHAPGISHRDVKPDNILLEGSRGRVVVTDFGIAKALSSSSGSATLTATGVAIGTPHYMSPEHAAGDREIDGRSDIYSLGVVAYQTLAGELPFQAPTVPGILMKQITQRAPPVTDKRPDVPEDLAACVMRSLEKDPEDRWPTADALRRALEARSATMHRARRSSGPSPSRGTRAPPPSAPPVPRGAAGRALDERARRLGRLRDPPTLPPRRETRRRSGPRAPPAASPGRCAPCGAGSSPGPRYAGRSSSSTLPRGTTPRAGRSSSRRSGVERPSCRATSGCGTPGIKGTTCSPGHQRPTRSKRASRRGAAVRSSCRAPPPTSSA